VRTAPDPATVRHTSAIAWVGWDHTAQNHWPAPDDREGDLNEHPRARWLDEIGTAAGRRLLAQDRPAVIGHGDWYSQNLRWIDRRLHVVHDWDSAVTQAEAAIAGQAAAVWPGTGLPGEVAALAQSKQFITAYERASGNSWTDHDIRAARAAGLWTRARDPRGFTDGRRSDEHRGCEEACAQRSTEAARLSSEDDNPAA
jgi:hypothetical protein